MRQYPILNNLASERKGDAALFRGGGLGYDAAIPRRLRICPAGMCFHGLNRAVARLRLFEKEADYLAFVRVLADAHTREPLPILAYVVMPNHRHFIVRPQTDAELDALRRCIRKGAPYGSDDFVIQPAARLQLEHTLRSRGRPGKAQK